MEENTAHAVLTEVVEEIRAGESFATPRTHSLNLAGNEYCFGFRPVHSTWVTQRLFFEDAIDYYRRNKLAGKLQIVQVFWPDSNGKFPFESDCDEAVCKEQGRFDIALAEKAKAKR